MPQISKQQFIIIYQMKKLLLTLFVDEKSYDWKMVVNKVAVIWREKQNQNLHYIYLHFLLQKFSKEKGRLRIYKKKEIARKESNKKVIKK